jgi:hypothetical protein
MCVGGRSSDIAGIVPDLGFIEAAHYPRRRGAEPRVENFGQRRQRGVTDARHCALDGRGEPFGTVVWKFTWLATAEQVNGDRT